MSSRPDGFNSYGKLAIDSFSSSELLHSNKKNKLRLIRPGPNFYMISDIPNVSLGMVGCSVQTLHSALNNGYHKKRMDMLAYTPVDLNYMETVAKTSISPARQNQFIQQNIFNSAPVRRFAIELIETRHSLDLTLKIHSGINILISDKIENSEEVNQR